MTGALLVVEDLVVETAAGGRVLDGVSLSLATGESLGLVGESGSGKTTLAHAVLGYARPGLRITAGSVRVAGQELVGGRETAVRPLRGRLVSYVPQDPATALNPSIRIGAQIRELSRLHTPDRDGDAAVVEALGRVDLPTDVGFRRRFPHQLSGGQQQRVAIAKALCCDPPLIVLDEPTTGLDVITQAFILDEVRRLRRDLDIALVYVSHDLSALASVTDHVAVLYAGAIVEHAPTEVVVRRPRHPYTSGLVSSVPDHVRPRRLQGIEGVAPGVDDRPHGCRFAPRCRLRTDDCELSVPPLVQVGDHHAVRCLHWPDTPSPLAEGRVNAPGLVGRSPLLVVEGLTAHHRGPGATVLAADDVSFSASAGSCLALVGESGSGKTTIARCVVGLHRPAGGRILFDGAPLSAGARGRTREQRRRMQVVFQNPYESLNPRVRVAEAIAWPARALRGVSRTDARSEVEELLERVRLPARTARRFPGELSGGERQRVAIARALAARPDLLVCDEVTSALDVSVQAAALDLLRELGANLGLALLFITHDLGVVASIADAVVVLERGRVVERGSVSDVLEDPREPYTRRLIAAAPSLVEAPVRTVPDTAVPL